MNSTFDAAVENCTIFHQDLHSTLEAQDRRINQEQKKEKKRLAKLQHEIEEATQECHHLTTRIKVKFF